MIGLDSIGTLDSGAGGRQIKALCGRSVKHIKCLRPNQSLAIYRWMPPKRSAQQGI